MKKLIIYITAAAFGFCLTNDVMAQRRDGGHRSRSGKGKEYARYQKKQDKALYKYSKKEERNYRNYYKERERAYVKHIKRKGERYRDHDVWYYNKRFHNRHEYVYFPAYRTYYDPYRRGYVYPARSGWAFATTVPHFMAGVNLGGLSVQFYSRLPL